MPSSHLIPDPLGPPPVGPRAAGQQNTLAVRIAHSDVARLMAAACRHQGIPAEQIDAVVKHYLEGELRGKPSHGVAKFCFESQFFHLRQGPPEVFHEQGVFAVVDAHREIGPLSAAFAVDLAVATAARHGAAAVGMINTQRYGILAPWTEEIARHGLIGIATNTSRAEAVPAGGRTPVLGVNPLAFALPTLTEPLSADLGTTLAPMGVLWEHRRSGQPLPQGQFVDSDGRPATDPDQAASAVVFGRHRGFALSLLLQTLAGSLFGFPMGSEVTDTFTTGYTFLALDPAFANPQGTTATANTRFTDQLRAAAAADADTWRLPGDRSRTRAQARRAAPALTLPPLVCERLHARARGDFTSD